MCVEKYVRVFDSETVTVARCSDVTDTAQTQRRFHSDIHLKNMIYLLFLMFRIHRIPTDPIAKPTLSVCLSDCL